jgi:hypothetical protein
MDGKILKELKGHSGNKIYLLESDNQFIVHKSGNVKRNVERLQDLFREFYDVPFILNTDGETFMDMEYIHGLDMKEYLKMNTINKLAGFIIETLNSFAKSSVLYDYTGVYHQKLDWVDSATDLPFSKDELISRLPKQLPRSQYHGDFTLENLMFSEDKFIMIDAVTIEYDSYIFDIAKLRQDLECKWFLRDDTLKLDVKLRNLQDKVLERFPLAKNDYILILMLLRVYRHTQPGDSNHQFIMKEINRLWK